MKPISLTLFFLCAGVVLAAKDILPAEEALIENQCQQIEIFFGDLRKEFVESTFNPAKVLVNKYFNNNEFGTISIPAAQKNFAKLLKALAVDPNEKGAEEKLAKALARQFVSVPYCFPVSDAATFVFKLLKLGVIADQDAFLKAFINSTSENFSIEFILYTLNVFLKCSDDFIFYIIDNFYGSHEEIVSEFIRIYNFIMKTHKTVTADAMNKLYRRTMRNVITNGLCLLGMAALYNVKALYAENDDHSQDFMVDNAVMASAVLFLANINYNMDYPKDNEEILGLLEYFGQAPGKLTTQNIKTLHKGLVKEGEIVRECPECQAERIIQQQKAKAKKQK